MKKHSQYPLAFTGKNFKKAQAINDRLHKLPRAGWVDRGVKNSESVGEHTDESVALAEKYFKVEGLSKMLRVHDWPESDKEIGDRRTDRNCPKKDRWSKRKKHNVEFKAMRQICLTLGSAGKEIFDLWLEFEEGKTERAKIAYQLDKMQAIKKAIEYHKSGESVVVQDFIDDCEKKITNPVILQMLAEAKAELKNFKA
jgi:putative hydrolases of HD superfamily